MTVPGIVRTATLGLIAGSQRPDRGDRRLAFHGHDPA